MEETEVKAAEKDLDFEDERFDKLIESLGKEVKLGGVYLSGTELVSLHQFLVDERKKKAEIMALLDETATAIFELSSRVEDVRSLTSEDPGLGVISTLNQAITNAGELASKCREEADSHRIKIICRMCGKKYRDAIPGAPVNLRKKTQGSGCSASVHKTTGDGWVLICHYGSGLDCNMYSFVHEPPPHIQYADPVCDLCIHSMIGGQELLFVRELLVGEDPGIIPRKKADE